MVKSTSSAGGAEDPSVGPMVAGGRASIDATVAPGQSHDQTPVQSADKARQRALQRDNQIRKTAGMAVSRQGAHRSRPSSLTGSPRRGGSTPNSLGNFELREAECILESNTIVEAARHMAAKRLDFVLVVDGNGRLVGIVTDKDLAFRVVAEGLDPRQTIVSQVMTRNPRCVQATMGVFEALEVMSKNHFRHLPVKQDEQVVGVLDIAKCLYDALQKLELADAAAHQIASALETVGKEFGGVIDGKAGNHDALQYADTLRDALSSPKLSSILGEGCGGGDPLNSGGSLGSAPQCIVVTVKTMVLQAVRQMKERRETALLVTDEQGQAVVGIFTSKDVLLRVVAACLDPATTSIIRVMTPHPDYSTPDTSIVSALRQMHNGHYLHLPVLNRLDKAIVGIVDVLQLTYAVLEQMDSLKGKDEAPLWHRLWSPTEDQIPETGSALGSYVPKPAVNLLDDFIHLPSSVVFKIKSQASDAAAILHPVPNTLELPSLAELQREALLRFGLDEGTLYLVDDEGDLIPVRDDAELGKFVGLLISSGKDKINLVLLQGRPEASALPGRLAATLSSAKLDLLRLGTALAVVAMAGIATGALWWVRRGMSE